jgi:hypothetical protein
MMVARKILAALGWYSPQPGDVVLDRYDNRLKTVEKVTGDRVAVASFVGDELKRGSLLSRNLTFVR